MITYLLINYIDNFTSLLRKRIRFGAIYINYCQADCEVEPTAFQMFSKRYILLCLNPGSPGFAFSHVNVNVWRNYWIITQIKFHMPSQTGVNQNRLILWATNVLKSQDWLRKNGIRPMYKVRVYKRQQTFLS